MIARAGLRVASWPYGLAMRVRNRAFERSWKRVHTAAVPVVSVGNLTLGGTGKTPCVEWVACFFRERGCQVTILSRGYGAETGRNDEAMVLEENLPDVPHLQGIDRVALAETAVEELEAELLVLDDGFQHRRLHRDLDIVLIDATRPPTRDYQFPRGTLREPASGLRRAGAILLTRCDQVPEAEVEAIRAWVTERFPDVPVATTEHRPTGLVGCNEANEEVHELVESLGGKTVGGFCGIGNPAAFRHTLESLGARIADFRTFPDHHAYTREDVDDLNRWAASLHSDAAIVTTQKDWVKLRVPTLGGRPLRAVRIGLHFRDGEATFAEVLERVVAPAE
ncbi:Tetraacyldisaccharide 4'-kinase [Gemmata sp. SH-PL17]|uniref:tetraacyldisaccharide 4'-kinase n=1 Tax=Gemmata sp. SH-PL17 TaxID=1630693 RepID=UPI00078DFB44|nr:tetraacyldisaccharide 4'-kinase [Gemmata sp. SH-PL17]AMV28484.1 Tetraacyldisaccharide 4'-kinase [Gemmata sp. SH-PL17]